MARRYIQENFEARDWLAVVVRNRETGETVQRITTAEQIASHDFQAWLRHKNAHGSDIYLSLNTLREHARGRTKGDLNDVRHLYLDLDEEGQRKLARIYEDAAVPHPNYEHAKRHGWWPEDRMNPISKVRQGGERLTTPIRLNLEELHQLIYDVLQQRERTMVLFDFAGGLRRSELMGSKWEDIDFVQRIFTPRRSVMKMRVGKLKTKGSADPVPLDDSVIEELLRWRAETPYAADDDYVFASPKMKGKQPYWMSRIMQHFIRPAAARRHCNQGLAHLAPQLYDAVAPER